jgi:spore germination protein YaaH
LRGYDYGGIGASVDFVFIMAYDWHETHSPPGPVAPIQEVRRTIEYAARFMRRNKIILGFARYGYDWDVTNPSNNRAISVQQAIRIAFNHQVPIQYSEVDQQAFFSYVETDGSRHEVWFENVRARVAKFDLVIANQLMGVGAWQLGLAFPQSKYLVNEFFAARKLI